MPQASDSATRPFERPLAHLSTLEPVFVGGLSWVRAGSCDNERCGQGGQSCSDHSWQASCAPSDVVCTDRMTPGLGWRVAVGHQFGGQRCRVWRGLHLFRGQQGPNTRCRRDTTAAHAVLLPSQFTMHEAAGGKRSPPPHRCAPFLQPFPLWVPGDHSRADVPAMSSSLLVARISRHAGTLVVGVRRHPFAPQPHTLFTS